MSHRSHRIQSSSLLIWRLHNLLAETEDIKTEWKKEENSSQGECEKGKEIIVIVIIITIKKQHLKELDGKLF